MIVSNREIELGNLERWASNWCRGKEDGKGKNHLCNRHMINDYDEDDDATIGFL